jgi:uncharacterized protein DUF3572
MRASTMTLDLAATLALRALAFLIDTAPAMERFVDQTGLDTASLRRRADEPEFLVSVLDFLLSDEELLIRFCESAACDVRTVHMARHALAAG